MASLSSSWLLRMHDRHQRARDGEEERVSRLDSFRAIDEDFVAIWGDSL
jgi:hypothetical protein